MHARQKNQRQHLDDIQSCFYFVFNADSGCASIYAKYCCCISGTVRVLFIKKSCLNE